MIRRNVVRYVCLAQVLASRDFSTAVRKRFPTSDSIVAAGFMLLHEKQQFDRIETEFGSQYWLPLQWALFTVYQARKEQLIESDIFCERICEEIRKFHNSLANLCKFDWMPLPLAYPQLVYLAVLVQFLLLLISKQQLLTSITQNNKTSLSSIIATNLHHWFPLTSIIQFFFYMAWTKVAMVLINPFGEDDDDFETNALIDRNFKIGMRIADSVSDDVPSQLKDSFWDRSVEALYSEKSARINAKQNRLIGSASRIGISGNKHQVLMIPLKKTTPDRINRDCLSPQPKQIMK